MNTTQIIVIDSEWVETGVYCPKCGWMAYSDGKHPAQCVNHECLEILAVVVPVAIKCPECGSQITDDQYCMMGHWCGTPVVSVVEGT